MSVGSVRFTFSVSQIHLFLFNSTTMTPVETIIIFVDHYILKCGLQTMSVCSLFISGP